jgi:DNA-binding NarL/FixJ family response regulator
MIRVVVIDDHPIVRYGFTQLLSAEADLEVAAQAGDAETALAAIAGHAPDVAVVDVSLGATSGIDLIREIKARGSRVAILVVSMHDEMLYAERSLRAGASGYLMKHEATDTIVKAVRAIAGGGMFLSEAVSTRLLQRIVDAPAPAATAAGAGAGSPLEALTDRELHVLQLLGKGLGTREIAERLQISIKTVESYRARLKEKMNLRSANELLRFAVRWVEDVDRPR